MMTQFGISEEKYQKMMNTPRQTLGVPKQPRTTKSMSQTYSMRSR